jgi:hypothetical protein
LLVLGLLILRDNDHKRIIKITLMLIVIPVKSKNDNLIVALNIDEKIGTPNINAD